MTGSTRTETDSFGPLEVPADKYWGAQTQRSILNFPIGWEKQPVAVVRALGVIKKAAAKANIALDNIEPEIGEAIAQAADDVISGKLDDHFPLVVWQTGVGHTVKHERQRSDRQQSDRDFRRCDWFEIAGPSE